MKNIARPNAFALNETLKVSNRNERIMKIRGIVKNFVFHVGLSRLHTAHDEKKPEAKQ